MSARRDQKALEAMQRYGGGFASALATAWQRADHDNGARLRTAFPDLLDKYRDIAAQVGLLEEET